MVQHGIQVPVGNGGKRAKELGHFIAKGDDSYMQSFLQKFKNDYEGKTSIEIAFCEDNPLIKKYVRYNQGGKACHCLEGSQTANQKVNNKWQPIECSEQCQYRQKDDKGKSACNRVGWLRFLIPSISKDKIWLMKITGQKSINRLDAFINLQKSQGTLLQNNYILFLKQEEQTSKTTGQTFNNFILNIMLEKDFISQNTIPKTQQNPNQFSTNNDQNVNNKVVNNDTPPTITKPTEEIIDANNTTEQNTTENVSKESTTKKTTTKETYKKETKSKSKKTATQKSEQTKPTESKNETTAEDDSLKDCYALLSTFNETIANKEYLIGEFADMKDKISNIVIRPEDSKELAECDLGTFVRLDVSEIKGRKFAMKLEFIEKTLKKVAA